MQRLLLIVLLLTISKTWACSEIIIDEFTSTLFSFSSRSCWNDFSYKIWTCMQHTLSNQWSCSNMLSQSWISRRLLLQWSICHVLLSVFTHLLYVELPSTSANIILIKLWLFTYMGSNKCIALLRCFLYFLESIFNTSSSSSQILIGTEN